MSGSMKIETCLSSFTFIRNLYRYGNLYFITICLFGLTACVETQDKSELFRLTPQSLAKRELQTRFFETGDMSVVLAACTATLQDIGFLVDESEVELGLIVASTKRIAIDPDSLSKTAYNLIAILSLFSRSPLEMKKYEDSQTIRISIVATPIMYRKENTAVRINFQRTIFYTDGGISREETFNDPEIYQKFFDKLSKALFLEAQNL